MESNRLTSFLLLVSDQMDVIIATVIVLPVSSHIRLRSEKEKCITSSRLVSPDRLSAAR